MISRVLAAVDGSHRAPRVLRVARELAARFNAELLVLRAVVIPPEFPPAAATTEKDRLLEFLEREALDEVRDLVIGIPEARPLARLNAEPWRTILHTADEVGADLIVLGSHGYGGLDRVLGTTAGHVANRARRNVLVVHERDSSGDRSR